MEISASLGHVPSISGFCLVGGASQLSSGKEHDVCLSAGIYLDKQENILPPNFIGTGILVSIQWLKQCRALQNISDLLASPTAEFASVQKHTAGHVSVLTSLQHLPWDETLGLQRSRWRHFQGHYFSAILFNAVHVKVVSGQSQELKITPFVCIMVYSL